MEKQMACHGADCRWISTGEMCNKNLAMNNTKKKSPISWVPTAYFAMGLPFVVLNMVTVLMFKGLEVDDKLITFWTSLILQEIFCNCHSADYGSYFRAGGFCVEPVPFFQYLHCVAGHCCF